MAKLIVNPGSPNSWDIPLRAGSILLGRGENNDYQIADGSVSGRHCEILLTGSSAVIKDLNSSNGTFVEGIPITQTLLQPGQTVRLGNVEMLYEAEAPAAVKAPVRVTVVTPVARLAEEPPRVAPLASAVPIAATIPPSGAPKVCRFHQRTPGRFFCNSCHQAFCELCVTTRQVAGAPHKYCRACGVECVPLHVPAPAREAARGYFSKFPEAFTYPFRGSGILILIIGTLLFGVLKYLGPFGYVGGAFRGFGWGLIARVFVTGYMFAFMQSILHSTAAGDNEMPSLPDMTNFWEDILLPCLQFLGLLSICFGPLLLVSYFVVRSEEPGPLALAVLPLLIFGCVYFPMAFLAVAMLDTVLAANPLRVFTAMAKVPLEYLLTLLLVGVIFGLNIAGNFMGPILFPRGFLTHNPTRLLGLIAFTAGWGVASLYLLTVNVRLLGLLYVTCKERLGWFQR